MEYKPELLSPAGSLKVLKAAANLGADAVYFGLSKFNARAGAFNFTNEDAIAGLDYLNKRGKKGYITLNTIIKDIEVDEVIKTIRFINEIGANGVIVQDLGVMELIKKTSPDLEIHASTQMTVHNLYGVKYLYENGVKRVVLSRELSLDEIKFIRDNTDCELEVFIHGALCVSYSGQCYMSSFIGERSGNRGKCAQPCRLNYELNNKKGTLLSLKDLESVSFITELKKLKIDSLKIEGRLKNEYYVAVVVNAYRKLLDNEELTKKEKDLLYNIFYRGGYTNYFIKPKEMFCFNKNENPYSEAENEAVNKFKDRILNEEIPDDLKLPLDIKISIAPFEFPVISGQANGKSLKIIGDKKVQEAKTFPVTRENVLNSFLKIKDTGFYIRNFDLDLKENSYIPLSELNNLRRLLIEGLVKKESNPFYPIDIKVKKRSVCKTEFIARVRNSAQFLWVADKDFSYIFAGYDIVYKNIDKIKNKEKIVLSLPRIVSDKEIPRIISILNELKAKGFTKALASNISHFEILKGFDIASDIYLNISNSYCNNLLNKNKVFLSGASPEINLKDLSFFHPDRKIFALGYGYFEVMITKNCIKKNSGKCSNDTYFLKDRKGENFILICANDCRNEILNPYPVVMSDKKNDFEKSGIDYMLLSFTVEDAAACEDIYKAYKNSENNFDKFTRGHFYRGTI